MWAHSSSWRSEVRLTYDKDPDSPIEVISNQQSFCFRWKAHPHQHRRHRNTRNVYYGSMPLVWCVLWRVRNLSAMHFNCMMADKILGLLEKQTNLVYFTSVNLSDRRFRRSSFLIISGFPTTCILGYIFKATNCLLSKVRLIAPCWRGLFCNNLIC